MSRAYPLLLAFLSLVGCARAKGPAAPGPSSRYRQGDWITYRYGGTFTATPVELTERVTAAAGAKLEITVTATRGPERRRWVQVLTDTPENQQNNVVDALYVLDDAGARRALKNEQNADLYALYDWTYVVPESTSGKRKRPVSRTLGGQTFQCELTEGRARVAGRDVASESVDCPDFLWTHADARFTDEAAHVELYVAEVVAFGHDG